MNSAFLRQVVSMTAIWMLGGTPPVAAADECCAAADRRTITVNGHGEIAAAADLAVVSLAVETAAAQADAAVAENAERSAAVAQAVKRLLGSDDEVATTRYSLQPRYEQRKGDAEPRIVGYVASNEVRVELHDIDTVGKVVDAAIRAGANRVGALHFTVEDPAPRQREALAAAGKQAQAQAETIAASLGLRLGRVVSASSSSRGPVMPRRMESYAMMARESALATTPIEAGDVTIAADVNVVYEIE